MDNGCSPLCVGSLRVTQFRSCWEAPASNENSAFRRISRLFRGRSSLFDYAGNSIKKAHQYGWLGWCVRAESARKDSLNFVRIAANPMRGELFASERDWLRAIIRERQRHRFGRRSEQLERDKLAIALKDVEQSLAADAEVERATPPACQRSTSPQGQPRSFARAPAVGRDSDRRGRPDMLCFSGTLRDYTNAGSNRLYWGRRCRRGSPIMMRLIGVALVYCAVLSNAVAGQMLDRIAALHEDRFCRWSGSIRV